MAEWINQNLDPQYLQLGCKDPKQWDAVSQRLLHCWGRGIRANPSRPPAPGSVVFVDNPEGQGGNWNWMMEGNGAVRQELEQVTTHARTRTHIDEQRFGALCDPPDCVVADV